MYCKGKWRGSSPVYKDNVLLVYFIKQNITFLQSFLVWIEKIEKKIR